MSLYNVVGLCILSWCVPAPIYIPTQSITPSPPLPLQGPGAAAVAHVIHTTDMYYATSFQECEDILSTSTPSMQRSLERVGSSKIQRHPSRIKHIWDDTCVIYIYIYMYITYIYMNIYYNLPKELRTKSCAAQPPHNPPQGKARFLEQHS